MAGVQKLLDVMACLRDPQSGCAWDIAQDFSSIAPYTIEEAYEVADAIDRDDMGDLKDELGDLLLQVVFHSRMAQEQGDFGFNDVVQSIVDKMVRRHPHVFDSSGNPLPQGHGEKVAGGSTTAINKAWEAEKSRERARKSVAGANSLESASQLDGVALNLPALTRAAKIQKRAAQVGFDWQDLPPVVEKLYEEMNEVREAIESDDATAIEDEVGDLLFTVVNLARHTGVDAELALRKSTAKFSRRFTQVEKAANEDNIDMSSQPLEVLDRLWDEAKKHQSFDTSDNSP